MALRSPAFRPLAETGQVIKFRKTSMFGFNEMVRYTHSAHMGWGPCDIDLEELFKHTSYLSILVHRRIIEVYKKYTKKLSELATK